MLLKTILFIALLGASFQEVTAQNRLIPARNVETLREVWKKQGVRSTADRYGANVWGGIDLTGDSIGDFGVYRQSTEEWYFYKGGQEPDTAAFQVIGDNGRPEPLFGRFKSTESRHVLFVGGYVEDIDDFRYVYLVYSLHGLNDTGINPVPEIQYDDGLADPPIEVTFSDWWVTDINHDEFDDVAISLTSTRTGLIPNHVDDQRLQTWFFLGGPDFNLNQPDVIVYDTTFGWSPEFGWEVRFADFDGDGYTDMMTGGGYRGTGDMLRFYWGDENSPQSWTERDFDRNIILEHGTHGINDISSLHLFDGDGDGATDFGAREYGEYEGTRLYLSGRGKNARIRSFGLDDADLLYENAIIEPYSIGFLNDSTQRFEPFALIPTAPAPPAFWLVSGGSWGPDNDYDAAYATGHFPDFPFGVRSKGIRDVTGDGWDDFLGARSNFGPIVAEGIAIILAGGPYIPFDDPTVSVREEPVAGDSRGLYLWPNPVNDELNIAWRGDLKRMPVRFEVFDARGVSIVSGSVDPWRGKALWQCADAAAGSYLLVGYDEQGRRISSAPILIQR